MDGIEVLDGRLDDEGRWHGTLHVADHLVGPPAIVQGGIASTLAVAAVRAADPGAAPVTTVDARLHRPTPAGRDLAVTSVRTAVGRHDVEVTAGGATTVTATVVMAGPADPPHVPDLVALADGPIPEPYHQDAFPGCWVCGPDNADGLQLLPSFARPDVVRQSWWPQDVVEDTTNPGFVDPVVIAAVLDCPTVWSALPHLTANDWPYALLSGFRVRYGQPLPMGDGARIVGHPDRLDGRKIESRAAILGEDGGVHAMVSAFQIGSAELPPV